MSVYVVRLSCTHKEKKKTNSKTALGYVGHTKQSTRGQWELTSCLSAAGVYDMGTRTQLSIVVAHTTEQ